MKSDTRPEGLASLLADAAALAAEAAAAAGHGDVEAAMRLDDEAERLRRRARARARSEAATDAPARETGEEGNAVAGSRGPAATARELTISALSELGVPSAPKAVADYVQARFGADVDPRALAALRRDEQRSWSSPRSRRPVYIVPALEGHRFLPLRGKIALSAWPLEDRLVGPWSERVDHLRATVNVARQAKWLREADPERSAGIVGLLGRYGATVASEGSTDPDVIESAASAELDAMQGEDRRWRTEAADRARAILDEHAALWGGRPPAAVGVGS
jgi:hypothetical protein